MGLDLVARAIIEGLESIPIEKWISHPHFVRESIEALCFISMRLLPADRKQMIAQLKSLGDLVLKEASRGFDITTAKIDLSVSPERALGFLYDENPEGYRIELHRRRVLQEHIDLVEQKAMNCGFDIVRGDQIVSPPRPVVQAEPELVQAARLADQAKSWYTIPDPRLVFLGGEEVYRIELGLWHLDHHLTPPGEAQRFILECLGRIQSPVTTELALYMTMRSKAKTQAKAWFLNHLDYARPILISLAKSSSRLAKGAAELLEKLPA